LEPDASSVYVSVCWKVRPHRIVVVAFDDGSAGVDRRVAGRPVAAARLHRRRFRLGADDSRCDVLHVGGVAPPVNREKRVVKESLPIPGVAVRCHFSPRSNWTQDWRRIASAGPTEWYDRSGGPERNAAVLVCLVGRINPNELPSTPLAGTATAVVVDGNSRDVALTYSCRHDDSCFAGHCQRYGGDGGDRTSRPETPPRVSCRARRAAASPNETLFITDRAIFSDVLGRVRVPCGVSNRNPKIDEPVNSVKIGSLVKKQGFQLLSCEAEIHDWARKPVSAA
jgi:hypothetical protein